MIDYRVYLVTDDPSRYRGNWLDSIVPALEGGVTCVQYRDTENGPKAQYERILRLKDVMKRTDAALVVNNDAELAAAVGAHGVHVGQGDLPPEEVRKIVGRGVEIGLSLTDVAQTGDACRRLAAGTVDCLGIGPVYDARKTKADAAAALGPEGLRAIVAALPPAAANCAIGGITLENAETVLKAGAKGLAVVSAYSKSENPYEVARNFALLFDNRRI